MNDWIKWLNPTAPIGSQPEALSAARASAVAIFVGVLWGCVGVIWLMTAGKAGMDAALAQAAADTPEAAGMAGVMTGAAIGAAVFFVVIQAILGFVQWKWPNIVIPIIFVILVVYGLVMALVGLTMMSNPEVAAAAANNPMWMSVLGIVILIAQALWHVSGIRGARALDRYKADAAI